ncbi:MAG: hypothetical protein ACPGUX_06770, partial [Halocynthiibacter sp.]
QSESPDRKWSGQFRRRSIATLSVCFCADDDGLAHPQQGDKTQIHDIVGKSERRQDFLTTVDILLRFAPGWAQLSPDEYALFNAFD